MQLQKEQHHARDGRKDLPSPVHHSSPRQRWRSATRRLISPLTTTRVPCGPALAFTHERSASHASLDRPALNSRSIEDPSNALTPALNMNDAIAALVHGSSFS